MRKKQFIATTNNSRHVQTITNTSISTGHILEDTRYFGNTVFPENFLNTKLREKCPNTEFSLVRIWRLFIKCNIQGIFQKLSKTLFF